MALSCKQCGLKIVQRPAPKADGGILVDLIDPTGRECYKYWVPPESAKSTTLRRQPCGIPECELAVKVRLSKAAFE